MWLLFHQICLEFSVKSLNKFLRIYFYEIIQILNKFLQRVENILSKKYDIHFH